MKILLENLPEEILYIIISNSLCKTYNLNNFKNNIIVYENIYPLTLCNKYFYKNFSNKFRNETHKFNWNFKYYKKYFNSKLTYPKI